jgi:hypothetical protein
MARRTIFNHAAPKREGAKIATEGHLSPHLAEKVEKRLLEILRSPLTLVLFVWAILFALAGVCFVYLE